MVGGWVVAASRVEIRRAGAAPNDHGGSGPDGRVSAARRGGPSLAHGGPRVFGRVVRPTRVEDVLLDGIGIPAAPDDHPIARPDDAVLPAGDGRVRDGGWKPLVADGVIDGSRIGHARCALAGQTTPDDHPVPRPDGRV